MYFSYEAKTGRGGPGGGKGEEGVSQRDNKSVLSPATMEPGRREERKEGFKPRPTYPPPPPTSLKWIVPEDRINPRGGEPRRIPLGWI